MKKQSVATSILKLLGIMMLSWILCLLVFSIFTADDSGDLPDIYAKLSLIIGTLISLAIYLGLSFNNIKSRKQRIKASKSNIGIASKRQLSLLDKASRVADRYMAHEKEVFSAASPSKSATKKSFLVKNSEQFSNLLLAYPDLKANENILVLLEQIRETENTIANFKINYNSEVEIYNSLITSFPANLFRKKLNLNDETYYQDDSDAEISDEALGI